MNQRDKKLEFADKIIKNSGICKDLKCTNICPLFNIIVEGGKQICEYYSPTEKMTYARDYKKFNHSYDIVFPLTSVIYDLVKSGEAKQQVREYNDFWNTRINKVCFEKYRCNIDHLYAEKRMFLNENLTKENQNFFVKFTKNKDNKKYSFVAECKLEVFIEPKPKNEQVWWDSINQTLQIDILEIF